MSNFQIAIIGVFTAFIVMAVLLFTGIVPGFRTPEGGFGGEVVLWGTISEDAMRQPIRDFNEKNKELFVLKYEEKPVATFEKDIVEALAADIGPDLFFLSQDLILKNGDKVFVIPFDSVPERDFKDSFIEEGELYLTDDGIIAFPFLIDPLVMYWNRDILSSSGVAREPVFWDEFFTLAPILTSIDNAQNINRSTVALGEFSNVTNAKGVLSTLILQSGDNIIKRGEAGSEVIFGNEHVAGGKPAESALRFFTEFSNPTKPFYSWNRSLPESKDMFVSGDLALYFGYAGELTDIVTKNPHLNFSISPTPQIRGNNKKVAFGKMQGLAVAKNSDNQGTAFRAAYLLSSAEFLENIMKITKLPPVRRDMLSQKQTDSYKSVFYESAIMSKGWLDPNPNASYNIFKDMVEDISSGRSRISEAVLGAASEMRRLVK